MFHHKRLLLCTNCGFYFSLSFITLDVHRFEVGLIEFILELNITAYILNVTQVLTLLTYNFDFGIK